MTDPKPILVPAGYVPPNAVAFGAAGEEAILVSPDSPLPVAFSVTPATSVPLAGEADSSAVLGPMIPEAGRPLVITLSGDWAGTVTLLRSVDGGVTLLPLTLGGAPHGVFTTNVNEPIWEESESGASLYLDVALLSGTLTYRLAQ